MTEVKERGKEEKDRERELTLENKRANKDIKDANVGSLLRLFKSKHFDIWMAVTYLHRFPSKGIIDYISNEFYRFEDGSTWLQEFEYYLPQLCHLVVAYPRETKALLQYLMDLCSRSVHFALRIGWLFSAIASPLPVDHSSKPILDVNERCAELRLKSELATMNGRRPESLPIGATQTVTVEADKTRPSLSPLMKSTRSTRVPVSDPTMDPDLAQALSQKERCDYYKAVQTFAERLSAISDSLRAVPPLERTAALFAEVTALNARLAHPPHSALLYFPSDHASSTMHVLLRITPGEAIVLNSRDRAPFLLYLETLRPSEDISPASPYLHLFAKELGTKVQIHEKRVRVIRQWSLGFHGDSSDMDNNRTSKSTSTASEHDDDESPTLSSSSKDLPASSAKGTDLPQKEDCAEDRKSDNEKDKSPGAASVSKNSQESDAVSPRIATGPMTASVDNADNAITKDAPSPRPRSPKKKKSTRKEVVSGEKEGEDTEDDVDFDFEHDDLEDVNNVDRRRVRRDSRSPYKSRSRHSSSKRNKKALRDAWIEEIPKTESSPEIAALPLPSSTEDNGVGSSGSTNGRLENKEVPVSVAVANAIKNVEANPSSKRTPASSPPGTPKRRQSILFRREDWKAKVDRIRSDSPFGKLPNWDLRSVIVKFGDDCRQERLALQLIGQFCKIWSRAKLPLYVLPYDILVLSPVACLIETIVDAKSLHQLKKEHDCISLLDYFIARYGPVESQDFKLAQCNFCDSLAGYSLVTYILQIKDRHNGNILIRDSGHLVHIDFGFMLSNSPGSLNFENGAFKLTAEYVQLMGGKDSAMWHYFKASLQMGFLELRRHSEQIIGLVSIMRQVCLQTSTVLPGLAGGQVMLDRLKDRFLLGKTDKEVIAELDALTDAALDSWRTRQYDNFQYLTNGILY